MVGEEEGKMGGRERDKEAGRDGREGGTEGGKERFCGGGNGEHLLAACGRWSLR